MVVYKFGGASVADAENIRNVASIINDFSGDQLVVVISAIGKTTNGLEVLLKESLSGGDTDTLIRNFMDTNQIIIDGLFESEKTIPALTILYSELEANLNSFSASPYDFAYDQIVSFGELISTTIIADYLNYRGIACDFVDARQLISTDSTFREGIVNWSKTQKRVSERMSKKKLVITQGFIGGDSEGHTTTLGREGSDYTAAILSYCLDVDYMAIWKDVPGVLTADPRLFENVELIDRLSYFE